VSSDWFEEAVGDLDEVEPDAEPTDLSVEELENELEKSAADETHESAEKSTAEPEDASRPDAGATDDSTARDAGESDPFGFGSGNSSASDTGSATEFDADTGGDEFGFGAGGPTPTDGPTPESSAPDSSTPRESSMAQSPEEFGFSLDDDDAPSPDSTPDAPSPEPSTADSGAAEPTTDEPADDPFGFGSSGGAGGGGSMPDMDAGDDDFGFGGFGGGGGAGGAPSPSGPEEFDDEEFESEIDRIDLGIEGLDDMILGGVPERSLIGIIGGAGTGKTTFGLQFLNQALKQGERAVFITLEQTEEAVLSTAEEKGWPFRQYVEEDMLAIVVLDPVEMANSLASIRGDISRLIREFGASRLVLDSVSLLEMMYDHPAKRRSEIFDFTRSLKEAGVTTLLTSEASEDSSHASRYGAVEYLTDAVFVLRYVRTSNFEETRLAIEIQKIRDANHSRATKPYDLTDEGMSVHKQANIF